MQVMMINVDDNEDLALIKNWATQYGLSFPLLNDVNDQTYYQYSPGPPHYIPHNALLDTAMNVLYTAVGYNEPAIINYINNYYQPAFSNNVSLSHGFMQMGVDTLVITSQMENSGNHNVELYAMFMSMDSSYQDSIRLYDDGNHHDGAAGDGLYGNSSNAPNIEQEFMVGIKSLDLDYNVKLVFDDLGRFTTIGPVSIYSSVEVNRFSNIIYFQLELQNEGAIQTAENVKAGVTTNDPYVLSVLNNTLSFGDIGAGQSAVGSPNFAFRIDSLPANHIIKFNVNISSNNRNYWKDSSDVIVGISKEDGELPTVFALKQNYPNPFNPSTTFEFSIPKSEFVSLQIFETSGKVVENLVSSNLNRGIYKYDWNAEQFSSGVYYYTIKAGEYQQTRKLILMK